MPNRAERRRDDDDRTRRRLFWVHEADGQFPGRVWASSMENRRASTLPRCTLCGSVGAIIVFTRLRICEFCRSIRRKDYGARSIACSTRSIRRNWTAAPPILGRQRGDAARLRRGAAMEHASDSRAASVRALADPQIGRPATPRDAARIVEILNATHERDEMYLPYTVESFSARVERSPRDYCWDRVRMTDRAVVGVWPAGDTVRFIIESKESASSRGAVSRWTGDSYRARRTSSKRSLRAQCGWLNESRSRPAVGLHVGGIGRLRPRARAGE